MRASPATPHKVVKACTRHKYGLKFSTDLRQTSLARRNVIDRTKKKIQNPAVSPNAAVAKDAPTGFRCSERQRAESQRGKRVKGKEIKREYESGDVAGLLSMRW